MFRLEGRRPNLAFALYLIAMVGCLALGLIVPMLHFSWLPVGSWMTLIFLEFGWIKGQESLLTKPYQIFGLCVAALITIPAAYFLFQPYGVLVASCMALTFPPMLIWVLR